MEQIRLKKLLTHQNKATYMPTLAGLFMILYAVCGAISDHYAIVLPMARFERDIPLIPWTIWIYIVAYPVYLIWTLASYREEAQMNRTMYGFIVLMVMACILFLIFPVTYPRSYYPLPPDNDMTTVLFQTIRNLDKPNNCFPSMHVGICYLLGYGIRDESKPKFYFSMFLSTVIALSTLTTKQHYSYDIFAGFILATGIYFFFRYKVDIKA